MTVRLLTIAGMLAALLAAGCAPDCASGCEMQNSCLPPGSTPVDCATFCGEINEAGNCEDQLDDLLTCVDRQDDYCRTHYQCETKVADHVDCLAGYCLSMQADKGFDPMPNDQTDPNCTALGL